MKERKNFTSFASANPELIKEWSDKNNPITPESVSFGSNKRVWWVCAYGHEWQAMVYARSLGQGCPYCAGTKVLKGFNDLQSQFPSVAAEWCADNGELRPDMFTYGSKTKVWWECSRGHKWKTAIFDRTRENGTDCPFCRGKKVLAGYNDLATLRPELVSEWSEKNSPLTPDTVAQFSHKRVWWKCSKGHEWQAQISKRSGGHGCPYCANVKMEPGVNDFGTLYPELAMEWSERNRRKAAFDFSPYSEQSVWWICRECGYEWSAMIKTRVNSPECPECRRKRKADLAAERKMDEWASKELEKNIVDIVIRGYCKEHGIRVLKDTHEETGLALQYYFPERKIALEIPKDKGRKRAFRQMEAVKSSLCRKLGIRLIIVLNMGEPGYEDCECVVGCINSTDPLIAFLDGLFG